MTLDLRIGKVYTFNTLAPALLGISIKNAKLIGIVDYNTALTYDSVNLRYRAIYPLLPAGTPDQPEACIYYRFQSESGEKIVLADQWIDSTTVEVIEHITIQATFTNVSVSDISRIRDALNALGYTSYSLKQL